MFKSAQIEIDVPIYRINRLVESDAAQLKWILESRDKC